MRVLILDDDDVRHEWYAAHYRRHEVRHVRTAAEAIEALAWPPELVHLDYDLHLSMPDARKTSGGIWLPEDHDYDEATHSGRAVVTAMVARASGVRSLPRVIVHSWNPGGARWMHDTLHESGFAVSYDPWAPTLDDRHHARDLCRRAGLPMPEGEG